MPMNNGIRLSNLISGIGSSKTITYQHIYIYNKCNKTFVPWGDIVLELLIYVAILIC